MDDWLMSSRLAARVTWHSRIRASKATSRFRSALRSRMGILVVGLLPALVSPAIVPIERPITAIDERNCPQAGLRL
jgi:hypothetical protein